MNECHISLVLVYCDGIPYTFPWGVYHSSSDFVDVCWYPSYNATSMLVFTDGRCYGANIECSQYYRPANVEVLNIIIVVICCPS